MKRLIAAVLCAVLALAPASAGQMSLLGAGKVSAGGAAPTVTFVADYVNTGGGGTTILTWTGVDFGNPAYIATRRVLLVLSGGAAGTTVIPASSLIGATTPDQATSLGASASSSASVDFVSGVVTSGTTGQTISITFTGTVGGARLGVYHCDNSLLSSSTPVVSALDINGSGTGTNTATVNTTTKSGGFILAGAWVGGGGGPSITSSTETYVNTPNGDMSNSAWFAAHVNGITSNASNSISTQGPPAGGNSASAAAAWR